MDVEEKTAVVTDSSSEYKEAMQQGENQPQIGIEKKALGSLNWPSKQENLLIEYTLKPLVEFGKLIPKSNEDRHNLKFKADVLKKIYHAYADMKTAAVVVCGPCSEKNLLLMEIFARIFDEIDDHAYVCINPTRNFGVRQGLWVFPKAFFMKKESGETIAVLLMECQAVCDNYYTSESDIEALMQIAFLISSLFIFNMTSVDEGIFRKLGELYNLPTREANSTHYYYKKYCGIEETGTCDPVKFFQQVGFVSYSSLPLKEPEFSMEINNWEKFISSLLNRKGYSKSSGRVRSLVRERTARVISCHLYHPGAERATGLANLRKTVALYLTRNIEEKLTRGVPLNTELFVTLISRLCQKFNLKVKLDIGPVHAVIKEISEQNNLPFIRQLLQVKYTQLLQQDNILEDIEDNSRVVTKGLADIEREFVDIYCELFRVDHNSTHIRFRVSFALKYPNDRRKRGHKYKLEEVVEIWKTLLDDFQTNFNKKRNKFMSVVVTNTIKHIDEVISETLQNWDESIILDDTQISLQRQQLKEKTVGTIIDMYKAKKITIDISYLEEIKNEVDKKSSALNLENDRVRKSYEDKFQRRIESVIVLLVNDLCEIMNSLSCASVTEFERICSEKEQLYQMYFKEHEAENIPSLVVNELSPRFTSLLAKALLLLKKKHLLTTVKKITIFPADVCRDLDISGSNKDEQNYYIRLSFDVDVKQIVFPKLQLDIVRIMNNSITNTTIILEIKSLNMFDNIEIDHALRGRYEHEQDRILYLCHIIQNRDSGDIKTCLEAFVNLRTLPAYGMRFRESFEKAYPGCTVPVQNLS